MKKMNEMSEKAKQLRREYNRKYRELNKDIINKRHNQWRHANKDKIKEYSKNYWEKKTKGLNTLNNNSADKMFEELGYIKDETGDEIIYQLNNHEICFYLKRKAFDCGCGIGREYIFMQELKAINKKVEELGWDE